MSARPHYFRIGLFVFAALLILTVGIVVFGAGQLFKPRVLIETYMPGTIQGIDVGSPLKFRGVPVGKVKNVSFVFNQYKEQTTSLDSGIYNYVYIEMEVTKRLFPGMFEADLQPMIEQSVEQGLRVRIEPAGITGLSFLNMDYLKGQKDPPIKITWKPKHYYIPSAPSEINSMLDSLNNIMREIEKLNVKGISDNLVTLLENLNESVTGADLPRVSKDLITVLDNLNRSISEADIEGISRNAQAALLEIQKATTQLDAILGNVEPLTEINPEEIQETISNLQALSENLRALSSELRSYPSQLIFGPPPEKPDVFTPNPKRRNR